MRQTVMKSIMKEALLNSKQEARKEWLRLAEQGPKGTPARVMRQMVFRSILKEARNNQRQKGD